MASFVARLENVVDQKYILDIIYDLKHSGTPDWANESAGLLSGLHSDLADYLKHVRTGLPRDARAVRYDTLSSTTFMIQSLSLDPIPEPDVVEDSPLLTVIDSVTKPLNELMALPLDEPLTSNLLCKLHAQISRATTDVSPLRKTPSYATTTGFIFPDPVDIENMLTDALQRYNADFKHPKKCPITTAVRLFHRLSVLHPFESHNGLLIRMVLARVLKQLGLADFPVVLSSGHPTDAHSHHYQALAAADLGKDTHLEYMLVRSLARAWANFRIVVGY